MGRKYYAYGTYSEDGVLYSANGKEIKNPESYYKACRKKHRRSNSSSNNSYNYNSNYNSYRNIKERQNASRAYHEYGIDNCEYMDDETLDLLEEGYLDEDDF